MKDNRIKWSLLITPDNRPNVLATLLVEAEPQEAVQFVSANIGERFTHCALDAEPQSRGWSRVNVIEPEQPTIGEGI